MCLPRLFWSLRFIGCCRLRMWLRRCGWLTGSKSFGRAASALVGRVGEVAGVSLPGTAHDPCPRRRVDRIPSIPGAAARTDIHVGSKLPGRDTPATSPTPARTLSLLPLGVASSGHVFIFGDARRLGICSRAGVNFDIGKEVLREGSTPEGRHHPQLRRRMVGPMSIRQLE